MTVYIVILERISTGEKTPSMLTRQASMEAALAYAEAAVKDQPDLRVAEVRAR